MPVEARTFIPVSEVSQLFHFRVIGGSDLTASRFEVVAADQPRAYGGKAQGLIELAGYTDRVTPAVALTIEESARAVGELERTIATHGDISRSGFVRHFRAMEYLGVFPGNIAEPVNESGRSVDGLGSSFAMYVRSDTQREGDKAGEVAGLADSMVAGVTARLLEKIRQENGGSIPSSLQPVINQVLDDYLHLAQTVTDRTWRALLCLDDDTVTRAKKLHGTKPEAARDTLLTASWFLLSPYEQLARATVFVYRNAQKVDANAGILYSELVPGDTKGFYAAVLPMQGSLSLHGFMLDLGTRRILPDTQLPGQSQDVLAHIAHTAAAKSLGSERPYPSLFELVIAGDNVYAVQRIDYMLPLVDYVRWLGSLGLPIQDVKRVFQTYIRENYPLLKYEQLVGLLSRPQMPGVGKFEEVPPSGLRLVLANAIVEGPISTIDTFLTQSEGSQGSDQKIVVIDSFEALKRFHLQLKGNPDLWGTISGIHMLVGLREASGTLTHVMTHLMNMAIMREQNTGQPMAAILDVVSKCDDAMQAALVHQRVIISGNRTFKSATDGDPFVLPPPIPPSQEVLQLLSD